jgi:hypothetical protein
LKKGKIIFVTGEHNRDITSFIKVGTRGEIFINQSTGISSHSNTSSFISMKTPGKISNIILSCHHNVIELTFREIFR